MNNDISEIVEGKTRMFVPKEALTEKVPPKEPAFFNPRAKLSRDISIVVYSAFWRNFSKPKVFLDGLAGLGVRGLRVSNELGSELTVVNDVNANALKICKSSAKLNNLENFEISEEETCRFFSTFSRKDKRGSIVDVDPFGSPARYFDCAIRATMHEGLLSVTATDLQVLHGIHKNARKRRYNGIPIKTQYGNEIALRLIIGCINIIAQRMDIEIQPQFVENNMHYYRVYLKILNRPDQTERIGYITHCYNCGHRKISHMQGNSCEICKSDVKNAGPLWVGKLLEKEFVQSMIDELKNFKVDKKCEKVLAKCITESEMNPTYYTIDEIASSIHSAPIKMTECIKKLQNAGYDASQTSLNPTGFKTNCRVDQIKEILKD